MDEEALVALAVAVAMEYVHQDVVVVAELRRGLLHNHDDIRGDNDNNDDNDGADAHKRRWQMPSSHRALLMTKISLS